uniref:Uncharacterized protein n=1 Tax=Trichobilharzia regenti TaxID=157069 RepID=A0AA85JBS0_TRIRE|nr:unnamed protein product [Trichobilharzia regenti]
MQSDHGSTSRYSTHILLSTHYQLPLKSLVTHSASVLVAVTHASLSRLHSFSPACRTAANNYLRVHFILSNSLASPAYTTHLLSLTSINSFTDVEEWPQLQK